MGPDGKRYIFFRLGFHSSQIPDPTNREATVVTRATPPSLPTCLPRQAPLGLTCSSASSTPHSHAAPLHSVACGYASSTSTRSHTRMHLQFLHSRRPEAHNHQLIQATPPPAPSRAAPALLAAAAARLASPLTVVVLQRRASWSYPARSSLRPIAILHIWSTRACPRARYARG